MILYKFERKNKQQATSPELGVTRVIENVSFIPTVVRIASKGIITNNECLIWLQKYYVVETYSRVSIRTEEGGHIERRWVEEYRYTYNWK